ncbi:MAG: stage II sporulation protein R [Firmicutes bacterium]|nr:stage II sporulation protein R [Bacillota bacterium]
MFLSSFKQKMKLTLVVIGVALGAGLILPTATGFIDWSYGRDGAEPTEQMIRLHVLANSDSPTDQAVKYKVRDRVVETMGPILAGSGSIEESRELTRENLGLITARAQETLKNEGFDYPVRAEMGHYDFPTRFYGDLCVPAGNYEAVRVVIGSGEGANWWCVLFPPLCFVGTTSGVTYIDADGKEIRDGLMPAAAVPRAEMPDTPESAPVVRLKIQELLTR